MTSDHLQTPSESDSAIGSESDSEVASNERTDGRTNGADTYGCKSGYGSRRERAYRGLGTVTLGELMADDGKPRREQPTEADARLLATLLDQREQRLTRTGARSVSQIMETYLDKLEMVANATRWPVIRSGEREQIPWPLRLSILRRDGYACQACPNASYTDPSYLELDHCIPWSAGGPDDSDNLRVLCRHCNQRRSNYIDLAHETNYRPTTWWCIDCWNPDSPYRSMWRDWTDLNAVPRVDPADEDARPFELVYCARCDYHSTSNLYFVGEMGRDLLKRIAWIADRKQEADV